MVRGIHDIGCLKLQLRVDYQSPSRQCTVYGNPRGKLLPVGNAGAALRLCSGGQVYAASVLSTGDPTNPATIVSWPISSSFALVPAGLLGPGSPAVWLPHEIPDVRTKYADNLSDMRYGFRTNTLLGGYSFGISYWHAQNYTPLIEKGGLTSGPGPLGPATPFREYTVTYDKNYDLIGLYMNKQLPWPGVVRAEAEYSPNMPFNTFNMGPDENGIVRRDNLKYMVAYDLTGFLYPDWHKTASIDVTLEHIGEWTPNSSDLQYIIYDTKYPNYHAGFNMRVSTSWLYNKIATDIILGYDTFGNSGLVMPSVTYTPAWQNNQLSFQLKYIGIYGDNNYEGLGIFRKKDLVLLTTQFNF